MPGMTEREVGGILARLTIIESDNREIKASIARIDDRLASGDRKFTQAETVHGIALWIGRSVIWAAFSSAAWLLYQAWPAIISLFVPPKH